MIPRLVEKYRQEIIPKMMSDLKLKNKLEIPCITKVVINIGVGQGAHDIKFVDEAISALSAITGQKPVITRAKKAISNFKIRQGDPIGCKVTLRKNIMYEFLDRFINIALPRIRDFQGISPVVFDEQGNFTVGISEHTVFPEIEYDKVQHVLGMDITIVMGRGDKKKNFLLLKLMGMPFRENKESE